LRCPCCHGALHRDDQLDSIYINCHQCGTFEFAGFKDLESGEMLLAYLNDDIEGSVDPRLLTELEKVLYRRAY
ncbi:MAG TPA: hypothetical protein VKK79_13010, partial [Candidatus Lokiarchaeia archaeon]|nr:hypothetical protein [Candidatus Lokiarchaeia archaeon]